MNIQQQPRSRAWRSRTTVALALTAVATVASPTAQAQIVEYYHLDALGNVRAVSNQAGQITAYHDYLPFGEEWNPQLDPQPRRFTGKERDTETGLDYFGARYYAPKLGRFITVDPNPGATQALLQPQKWNRYAHSLNNPLRYVDPDGRDELARDAAQGILSEYQQHIDDFASGGTSRAEFDHRMRQAAVREGVGIAGAAVVTATAAVAAEAAPAVVVEAQLVVGTCLASAACRNAVTGVAESVSGAPPGAMGSVPAPTLTPQQTTKLTRFKGKLPKGNTGTHVDQLGDDVMFTAEVPGKVPGSKAVYQKLVRPSGETTSYFKTTVDPKGNVVHVKDKLPD